MASPKRTVPGFNRFSGLAQGILRWAGARRSGNAASIPPNMFRDLENVRFEGQDIVCRGGQVKYNRNDVLEGCIDGFIPPEYEPPPYKQRLMICASDPDGDAVGLTGSGALLKFINGLDHIEETDFLHRAYISYIAGTGAGGSGGTLYQSSTSVHDSDTGEVDFGIKTFTLSSSDAYTGGTLFAPGAAVHTDGSGWGQVCKLGSDVFFTRYTTGNIIVYIGPIAAPSAERTVASDAATEARFCAWNVIFNSKMTLPILGSRLDMRTTGGVWTTAALPASCAANRRHPGAGGVTFGSDLYFTGYGPGGGNIVMKMTTGNVTSSVYGPSDGPAEFQALCSHNGALWFAYSPDDTGIELHYSADGASWTRVTSDTNLGSLDLEDANPVVRQLISMDGKLYMLVGSDLLVSEFPDRIWEIAENETGSFFSATVHTIL